MKIRLSELKRVVATEVRRSLREGPGGLKRKLRLEKKLIKYLDLLDRTDTDEKYRFPHGRPGPDRPSEEGDRAYGLELGIENILDELDDAGYERADVIAIDPRIKGYMLDIS